MGKKTQNLPMTADERELLESWIRAKTTPQRVVFRAQICLFAADGLPATEIADRMKTSRPTVLLWRKRFQEQGPEGLTKDAPRGPSSRKLDPEVREAIVQATLNSTPLDAPHWTTRTLAKALGVSNATVARIWKTLGAASRKKRGGKRQKEKPSESRFVEIAGVYLNPPVRAFALKLERGSFQKSFGCSFSPEKKSTQLRDSAIGCDSCLSESLKLLNSVVTGHSDLDAATAGLWSFVHQLESNISDGGELHLFLEDADSVKYLVDNGLGALPNICVQIVPRGYLSGHDIQELLDGTAGNKRDSSAAGVSDLVAAVDAYIREQNGSGPFLWSKKPNILEGPELCKVILETLRHLTELSASMAWQYFNRPHFALNKEEAMNWKPKLESWFAAAAFAEEGEHKTALQIAETPIPETREAVSILPSLSTAFAAAAFAEENCHEYAAEILAGVARKASFLETVGLQHAKVFYGIAHYQESFVEAVGLSGVRLKYLTVTM
ncbi:helix-turn-helix domain-containing protein [Desulfomonile tiedjei]|uniref:Transposase n=1 Tax=Desulfomonile tiedjei (strain ATCC 49306 / DSM 6799 / DCB-1) TaxID=706587 RepID=I4CBY5_DESTA|nr:helix-turn-helix domain-containing protein [Desulfomonile tiedjei]AFM27076.1 transposase [Desulfomonile tiedjei DSM 6799]